MKKWIIIVASIFFVNSCGEFPTYVDQPTTCSIEEQNKYVYEYMQNNYLWYKDLPEIDYKSYSSPESLLSNIKVQQDKWSFIINTQALEDYFSGEGYIGYGFKLMFDQNSNLIITLVYPNSPASRANLLRGNKIIKINGVDVADISNINSALGDDRVGVETTLEIDDNSEIKRVTIYKEKINSPSVLETKVLDIDGLKVGYLLFDKFIEPSTEELKESFQTFKDANIDSLIIDLRYNGGGLVNVANDLVSLIVGENNKDSISMSLEFNDKNIYKNSSYYIKNYSSSFYLDRVYFITTNQTCSASESVINALEPYGVDVKLIGSTTCGKPVGMSGSEFCSKTIMPIEFKIVNSSGYGDYFSGIQTTCAAEDDIYHNFGDSSEKMLKETIYLIENGICSSSNKLIANYKTSPKKRINLEGLKTITGAF